MVVGGLGGDDLWPNLRALQHQAHSYSVCISHLSDTLIVSLTFSEFESHTERFQIPCLPTSTNVVFLRLVLATHCYKLQKKCTFPSES